MENCSSRDELAGAEASGAGVEQRCSPGPARHHNPPQRGAQPSISHQDPPPLPQNWHYWKKGSGIEEDIAQLDFPNLGGTRHPERQLSIQETLGDLCVGEGQGSLSRPGSCPAVLKHLKDQWDEDPTWPSTLRSEKHRGHLNLEEQKCFSLGLCSARRTETPERRRSSPP